jgi:hypothetical protein
VHSFTIGSALQHTVLRTTDINLYPELFGAGRYNNGWGSVSQSSSQHEIVGHTRGGKCGINISVKDFGTGAGGRGGGGEGALLAVLRYGLTRSKKRAANSISFSAASSASAPRREKGWSGEGGQPGRAAVAGSVRLMDEGGLKGSSRFRVTSLYMNLK